MPTLDEHHASETCKLLIVGDPGGGKTGSLASLANAGYKLRILDFDNGLDVLHSYVKPECRGNVVYVTLTDRMKMIPSSGMAIPLGEPTAYKRGMELLNKWRTDSEDLGPVAKWGPEEVLVIDSLTMHGRACLQFIKHMNNKITEPDWEFYGAAMSLQEKMLDMLYSAEIKCNVIVMAHIVSIAPRKQVEITGADGKVRVQSVEAGDARAYPSALGNKLPPKVGRFFNAVLRCRSRGSGSGVKRFIETISDEEIELKNPAPTTVPRQLDLGEGLAQYFELVKKAAKPTGDGGKDA